VESISQDTLNESFNLIQSMLQDMNRKIDLLAQRVDDFGKKLDIVDKRLGGLARRVNKVIDIVFLLRLLHDLMK
ncbi:unnamed protein product, partial [Rotaria magnacalcarata]